MKKLMVKKGSTCMACLECVRACSEAFYKEFDPDKSCIQVVEKKSVRPLACPQCGKCAEVCEAGAHALEPVLRHAVAELVPEHAPRDRPRKPVVELHDVVAIALESAQLLCHPAPLIIGRHLLSPLHARRAPR